MKVIWSRNCADVRWIYRSDPLWEKSEPQEWVWNKDPVKLTKYILLGCGAVHNYIGEKCENSSKVTPYVIQSCGEV
jgi:hypothetical protein